MYRKLYKEAKTMIDNAYAPYSRFKVGAAVMTTDGKIFKGANIENASFGAGICAEQVAVSAAVSAGEREFDAIAVVSGEGSAWPCGICRQFMYEFSPEMKVITGDDEDHLEVYELAELLPKGFVL
ncbi:MAG: cytidine deaminase [Eubacteriales bacterium]|nr:cytidine deaminase [Eubacteriales bacterium]NLF47418.1 cytidine deaminase [Clostridiales bacterium]